MWLKSQNDEQKMKKRRNWRDILMEERGKKFVNFDFRRDMEEFWFQVVQFVPETLIPW